MFKGAPPSGWGLVVANDGRGVPSSVAADPYWEDISLQASARLARLEDERKQHAVEDEIRFVRGRRAPLTHRLALMVAVGAMLLAGVVWLLLKAVPTPGLPS